MTRLRLSKNVRNRDWWGVAIDLVILVLGVFLGIQAANWNDARKDVSDGRQFLDRIRKDLRDDSDSLDRHLDVWTQLSAEGDRALRYAEDGVVDGSDWQTLLDFYQAGIIWTYASNDATYRELVSSGRLDLIRDVKLRGELADYYGGRRSHADVVFRTIPAYRDGIRAALPYRIQRYILEHCQGDIANNFQRRPCSAPPGDDAKRALDRIAQNDKLVGDLRSWVTLLKYIRAAGTEFKALAIERSRQIDASLR